MKSTTKLILISFVVVLLFSASVAAAIPTPGGTISKSLTFLKGLLTGADIQIKDATFIIFILYFILLLAIFMEGMRFVPLFGERGQVNKSGKWFAFAAALLADIALFAFSKGDVLERLVAPFGIWGGLILAAIIAYITFRFLRDLEAFRDSVMIAMGVAAATGMTFAGLLLNLETVLGWGFLILIGAILVGFITAFVSHRQDTAPDRHAEREQRTGREVERFRTAAEQREHRRGRERRENSTRVPRARLTNAINTCEELVDALRGRDRRGAVQRAQRLLGTLQRQAQTVVQALRNARRRDNALVPFWEQSGAIIEEIEAIEIPAADAADWDHRVTQVRNAVTGDRGIRDSCGNLLQQLNEYVGGRE